MLRSSKVKITCFYCNQPSYIPRAPTATGRASTFDCPRCTATNHFDKDGNFVDYTPPEQPFVRYAQDKATPRRRAARHQSVLCRTCESNHAIVVGQLANYLPDESDPNYEYLAEHIDDFRRELEEKYPALCNSCAPKVEKAINADRYTHLSKGMARVLVTTEKRLKANQITPPKSLGKILFENLLVLGWLAWGTAYWASIALLMFWQLTISIFAMHTGSLEGMQDAGWNTCLAGSYLNGRLNNSCYAVSSKYVNIIFPWALILSFYDYKWLAVRRRPGSYVEDRVPYLFCQAIVSIFIGLSWWYLGPGGDLKEERRIIILSNASLLIEFFVLWIAFTSLKVVHPVHTISLTEPGNRDRKEFHHMPPLLVKSGSDLQDTGPKMAFRPTGPSVNSYINTPSTPPSKKPQRPYVTSAMKQTTPKYTIETYQPPRPFQSVYSTPNPPIPEYNGLPAPDPDAMDWNPSFNEPDTHDNFGSFSEHRPSSPLGFNGEYDFENSDDDEDAKTEVYDSPARPMERFRSKTLHLDGMLAPQTGLESLFEVAAKLDHAKPINQPGILKKRAHRVGQEAARLLAVCFGLVVLISSSGLLACAGLFVAIGLGTGWRFANAAFRGGDKVQGLADMWKRNLAILMCFVEFCAGGIISAEMMGFHVLPQPIYFEGVNMPPTAPTIESSPTDLAHPFSTEISLDMSPPDSPITQVPATHLMQLIMRLLFFSLAAHQTWDFARVFTYRGTPFAIVEEEAEPVSEQEMRDRKDPTKMGLYKPVNSFGAPLHRAPSPPQVQAPAPAPAPATTTGFGGLSLGGPSSGNSVTQRNMFSSWAKREPDVGIKKETPQRFGATTRSMKTLPPGLNNDPRPWTGAPGSAASSPFQRNNWS